MGTVNFTETQYTTLENIWLNDHWTMGPLALDVLMSLAGYEPMWSDYQIPAELRNMQIEGSSSNSKLFESFPNPAKDFITMKRLDYIDEVFLLELHGADGRIISTEKLLTGQTELTIVTNQLAEGAYMWIIKNEVDEMMDRIMFIKIN